MMKWMTILGLIVIFLVEPFYIPKAFSSERVCTIKEARYVEEVASTAKSWQQLYEWFDKYEHCDDGAIAAGFSESVSILLADHWQEIRNLSVIAKSDPEFKDFVIKHIDETVPETRLNDIEDNSFGQCAAGSENLCHDIQDKLIRINGEYSP